MNTGLLSLALGKLYYTRAISFFLLFNLCHPASFPLYPLFIKIYIYISIYYIILLRVPLQKFHQKQSTRQFYLFIFLLYDAQNVRTEFLRQKWIEVTRIAILSFPPE